MLKNDKGEGHILLQDVPLPHIGGWQREKDKTNSNAVSVHGTFSGLSADKI